MENGPVLIITFQAQQISCVKDSKGNVIEGDSVWHSLHSLFRSFLTHFIISGEDITRALRVGLMSRSE